MDKHDLEKMLSIVKYLENSSNLLLLPPDKSSMVYSVKSSDYVFQIDFNRKGHRLTRCTFQLRKKNLKLYRLDFIGRPHTNPPGNYKYANCEISCPHIHSIKHPLGLGVALPIEEETLFICDDKLIHMINLFKYFLKEVNVANRNDFEYLFTEDLV